jgi:small subunit ribosomal protein S16
MVRDVDARAVLKGERINYWLSVGAQPSDKVKVLIKKYGAEGTHLEQQKAALDRLAQSRSRPEPIRSAAPAEPAAEQPPAEAAAEAAPAEPEAAAEPEKPAEETTE